MILTKEQLKKDLENNVFAYVNWSLDFVDSLEVKEYLCLSPQDYTKVEINEYLEAFDKKDDDPISMKKIADLYNGYKTISVSLPYYETLLEKGDNSVCLELIAIYNSMGKGIEKLAPFLEKMILVESNEALKLYYKALLAGIYEEEKKYDEAYSIYESEPSHFYSELGLCYLLGKGVKKDEKKAYLYFLKGSRERPISYLGSNLTPKKVPASYYLFKAFAKGEYLPKDEKKALMYGDIFMRLSYKNDDFTISHKMVRYDPDYVSLKKDYLNNLVDKEESTSNLLDQLEVFSSVYFDEKEDCERIIKKLMAKSDFDYLALFEDVALKGYYFGYFSSSPYKHKRVDIYSERYIYKASYEVLLHLAKKKNPIEIADKIIEKAKENPSYLGDVAWPRKMDVIGELGKERAKELYKRLLVLDYPKIQNDELDEMFGIEEKWLEEYLGVKE